MNKILFSGMFACCACTAWAGSKTLPQVVAPSLPLERHVAQPFSVTGSVGLMYEQVGSFKDTTGAEYEILPSLLYGGSLGVSWDYLKTGAFVHSLGFSAGYYTGSQNNWMHEDTPRAVKDFNPKAYVDVIPLTLSYDVKRDLTNSVTGFFGARGGMMIRTTKVDGSDKKSGWSNLPDTDYEWRDVSSTKIIPMFGIGAGVQTYLTSRWVFSISADFLWSFGKDCGQLIPSSKETNPKALQSVSKNKRFYAVVNVGVTYSF